MDSTPRCFVRNCNWPLLESAESCSSFGRPPAASPSAMLLTRCLSKFRGDVRSKALYLRRLSGWPWLRSCEIVSHRNSMPGPSPLHGINNDLEERRAGRGSYVRSVSPMFLAMLRKISFD
jgi:hypothetical protein